MSKIVVLNSGGFDSVVLAHEVNFYNHDKEIHNLFFDYGQLNVKSERECSLKCAEKLGFIHKEINIPNFEWSDSVLSGGNSESQYIPLRNLILISYALSYAESIGADEVYFAFINPEGAYYKDTSPLFLQKLKELSMTFGIKVYAPFIKSYKGGLLKALARKHGIYREEVHSCNYGDEPCGKCGDCEALDEIFEDIENMISDDIFIDNNFKVTEDFIESVKNSKITTAKLYINNSCQFSCSHCFIGKHKLYGEQLTIQEWCKVLEQLAECGITSVDFFGKEPLFNGDVFLLMRKCRSLGLDYGLITNGVNVGKYIDQLEVYKPRVAISVESLDNKSKYRTTGVFISDVIKLLVSKKIPLSVSIDLSDANAKHLVKLIREMYKLGVREFYIKPLRPFGESEHYLMDRVLSPKMMFKCMEKLQTLNKELNANIRVSLAMMDADRYYHYDKDEYNKYFGNAINNRMDYVNGIFIDVELYCHRFKEMISITPDGYVLGCASEYCTDYSHFMNIREHSIEDCIRIGKMSLNHNSYKGVGCYFCKEYRKEKEIFQ